MARSRVRFFGKLFAQYGFSMQTKLIVIFLLVKVIPLILLTVIAWRQFMILGDTLKETAVHDATAALNDSAVRNIERMSTDTANQVAEFLYARDDDILYLSKVEPTEKAYRAFIESTQRRVIRQGKWQLAPDGKSWVNTNPEPIGPAGVSSNIENNDMDGFNPIPPVPFTYDNIPLYDEISFVDLNGMELIKVVSDNSPKKHYPMNKALRDISKRENTYVKAETHFPKLKSLRPGEIFVSDVIGAYVGSNYIGMYTPDIVAQASRDRGYPIPYTPETQAFSNKENPVGQRFEGIVRWATPVG